MVNKLEYNKDFWNEDKYFNGETVDYGVPIRDLFGRIEYYNFCIYAYKGDKVFKKYIKSTSENIYHYMDVYMYHSDCDGFKLFNNKNKIIREIWKNGKKSLS